MGVVFPFDEFTGKFVQCFDLLLLSGQGFLEVFVLLDQSFDAVQRISKIIVGEESLIRKKSWTNILRFHDIQFLLLASNRSFIHASYETLRIPPPPPIQAPVHDSPLAWSSTHPLVRCLCRTTGDPCTARTRCVSPPTVQEGSSFHSPGWPASLSLLLQRSAEIQEASGRLRRCFENYLPVHRFLPGNQKQLKEIILFSLSSTKLH